MEIHWFTKAFAVLLFTAQYPVPTMQGKCVRALQGKTCEDVYALLQKPPGASGPQICRLRRIQFMNRCDNLLMIEDEEPECRPECHKHLNALHDRLRKNLFFCDCKDNLDCIWFQQRTYRCMNQTLKYKLNCDLESQKCKQNKQCFQKYKNWFEKCQDMFTGYKCTFQCLDAERALYDDPVGRTLETCECAGSKKEEKFCRSVRRRREKLCQNPIQTNEIPDYYPVADYPSNGVRLTGRLYGSLLTAFMVFLL